MSGAELIFEQPYKGHLWRLEISHYRGHARGNWRKWYQDQGEWKPTKEGCTIPLERVPELAGALTAYAATMAPSGPENGS